MSIFHLRAISLSTDIHGQTYLWHKFFIILWISNYFDFVSIEREVKTTRMAIYAAGFISDRTLIIVFGYVRYLPSSRWYGSLTFSVDSDRGGMLIAALAVRRVWPLDGLDIYGLRFVSRGFGSWIWRVRVMGDPIDISFGRISPICRSRARSIDIDKSELSHAPVIFDRTPRRMATESSSNKLRSEIINSQQFRREKTFRSNSGTKTMAGFLNSIGFRPQANFDHKKKKS